METIEITSLIVFFNALKQLGDTSMYRGQGNIDWPLVPAVARMSDHVKADIGKEDIEKGIIIYVNWDYLEKHLLDSFKKYSFPFLNKIPINKIEWLILAQHHGLPTRLLDWTTNPLKGLFFAVENPNHKSDGVLWGYDPNGYYEDISKIYELRKGEINFLLSYFPDHLNDRIIAQESCFTYFPFPERDLPIPPLDDIKPYKSDIKKLTKFIVPLESKKALRSELRKLGISHRSLFPDLDGLSLSIRREFHLRGKMKLHMDRPQNHALSADTKSRAAEERRCDAIWLIPKLTAVDTMPPFINSNRSSPAIYSFG